MQQWDPASGMMVDDVTGMPPGMMPPQTLPDDPVPPTPQLSQPIAPQQQTMAPPTTPRPDYSNLPLPALLPSEGSDQVQQAIGQGYDELTEGGMGLGNILSLPVTAPLGILEELRGLVGMSTVGGWAEQADARYDNPDKGETRAFGKRVAEEPAAGDRYSGIGSKFMGLVTGESQRRAMAGKVLKRQILEYNARRKANIEEHKDVMGLQQGQQSLDLGELTRQQKQFQIDNQAQKLLDTFATSAASRNASDASAAAKWYDLSQKKGKAGRRQALTNRLMLNPALVDDWNALVEAAGGDLDVASEALSAVKGYRTRPDAMGVEPGQRFGVEAGQASDIARTYSDVAGTEEERAIDQARLDAANAREDAQKERERADKATERQFGAETKLGEEARDRVAQFYQQQRATFEEPGWFDDKPSQMDQIKESMAEEGRVQALLQSGVMDRATAYAIASGDLGALATPLDQPTPAPRIAAPTPMPTATPRPADYESPAQIRERVLAEQMGKLSAPRPTPMAQPTRATAGPLRTEDERAKNQVEVNVLKGKFNEAWKKHPVLSNSPIDGQLYKEKWLLQLKKSGLTEEALSPEPVR